MRYVPYVGFATHRHATVRIHLHFKRLMFMRCFVLKNKIKWVVTVVEGKAPREDAFM
jgi:hypothetical protein